jgi:ABC-2 type transport system ATP-binding protein
MIGEPIIRLDRVSVRYGRASALEGVTLEVRQGEMLALLGPSGAGKSTTLRVLIGQVAPSSGRITIAGRDLSRDWSALKSLFGYVPDRDNHIEEFSARGNLRFFAGLYRVSPARVEECLRLMELSDAADGLVRTYSLGMRRKLLLARALLHCPRLLFLDEPTANLDPAAGDLVRRTLRDLASAGCTIVLATHDTDLADQCDRVALLRRGRLAYHGVPDGMRSMQVEPDGNLEEMAETYFG